MTPPAGLALGLDIGGTSTRALVVDLEGVRHGAGLADGANLTSHSLEHALDAVSTALEAALENVDPARVRAAVIGSAGDRNLSVPKIAEALADRWRRAGLTCDYDVHADALVAFVAGTQQSAGTLLLSGTGALVARAEDRRLVHIVDAHGWLLGDLGSGFWLGREAVRATLSALDRRVTPSPLGQSVLQTLLGPLEPGTSPRDITADLVMTVHSQQPVALARLAPLLSQHAGSDPEADRIIAEAADHLMRATSIVRPPGQTTPFVLAGSLLTNDTPLARLIRPRLSAGWPGAPISAATDATAGAAWLAAVKMSSLDEAAAAELHARLLPA